MLLGKDFMRNMKKYFILLFFLKRRVLYYGDVFYFFNYEYGFMYLDK